MSVCLAIIATEQTALIFFLFQEGIVISEELVHNGWKSNQATGGAAELFHLP